MSGIEQFSSLVEEARRGDGYINATMWAKAFGSRLDKWKQLPETKAKVDDLSLTLKNSVSSSEIFHTPQAGVSSSEIFHTPQAGVSTSEFDTLKNSVSNFESVNITQSNSESVNITQSEISPWIVERVGKTWVTWIHPILAVHLASYLDPAFANYVAEVFVRYVNADPHLAADIASRQNTVKGLDIINEAVQKRYKFLEGRDWHYTKLTKVEMSYYSKVWGLPAKDLRPIDLHIDFDSDPVLMDFLHDKVPGIHRTIQAKGLRSPEEEAYLVGYFKKEIDTWLKERDTDDSF